VILANIPFLTASHALQAELTLLIVIAIEGIMNQAPFAFHALPTNSTIHLKNCALNVISTAKNVCQQAKLVLIVKVNFFFRTQLVFALISVVLQSQLATRSSAQVEWVSFFQQKCPILCIPLFSPLRKSSP